MKDPGEVISAFLKTMESPFDHWYPVREDDEVDTHASNRFFLDMQKELGEDDLIGRMPFMRYQPKKGTPKEILMWEFRLETHQRFGMRTEEEFRTQRSSFATNHSTVRSIGGKFFFGGFAINLDDQAFLKGPLYAGSRCTIRTSAKLIGPILLGDGAYVNTSAILGRTILGAGSQIEEHATIKDSIIGRGVFIESGVKLLHRSGLQSRMIVTKDFRTMKEAPVSTGRHKFGAVIGDDCHIGANTVLEPGTILFPGCHIPAQTRIRAGIYEPDFFRTRVPGVGHTRAPNCS